MTKEQKKFFIQATILMGALVAISQVIFFIFFETFCFLARISAINVVFVWLVTCVCHHYLLKTVTEKPKIFNLIFLMQTAAKLLLYVTFLAVSLLIYQKQFAVYFVVHFFVVYLIFAIFEVSLILKFVNNGKN